MSIITPPNANTPLTHDQLLAQLIREVRAEISNQFNSNVEVFNSIWKQIYANHQFTASEIFTLFGTDAVQLLTISSTFGNAINAITPNTVSLIPPVTLTPNADGTVTVTPKA